MFISLDDWDERPGAELHVNGIIESLNAQMAAEVPEAIAFAFGPPAIPGLGTGSGFTMQLQDRAGNTPAYLAEQTQNFIQAATARPEIGGAISMFRAEM